MLTETQLTQKVEELLSFLPATLTPIEPVPTLPAPNAIASLIDHTLLAPSSLPSDVERVCHEGAHLGAATVCVNSCMIPTATKALEGSKTRPISVVGFPFGATATEAKAFEAKVAVSEGATEIDMVQNVGWLKAKMYYKVYQDVSEVVQASSPSRVKVILESASLTREELAISSLLACLAGAAYIKTSTGYGPGGATAEAVRLMSYIAKPLGVKVKASGGIRSLETVRTMLENGAERVGASGTKGIIEEAKSGKEQAASSGY